MTERQYVPEVGKWVKLIGYGPYQYRHEWMRVDSINHGESVDLTVILHGNTPTDIQLMEVPLSAIEKPIGWHPRYTIYTSPDRIGAILGWFSRGITVRQSHYMPECSTAYQPMDADDVPSWKFAGNTVVERVPPELCGQLFRVVKLESEYDVGIPAKCKYCTDGKLTPENNPVLVGQDTIRCAHCGLIAGFSFSEPYHATSWKYGSPEMGMDTGQCANVRQAGECWACNGTGLGKTCLSELSRKDRQKAIRDMHNDGWKVSYNRHLQTWVRERETVVKDWEA